MLPLLTSVPWLISSKAQSHTQLTHDSGILGAEMTSVKEEKFGEVGELGVKANSFLLLVFHLLSRYPGSRAPAGFKVQQAALCRHKVTAGPTSLMRGSINGGDPLV